MPIVEPIPTPDLRARLDAAREAGPYLVGWLASVATTPGRRWGRESDLAAAAEARRALRVICERYPAIRPLVRDTLARCVRS